MFHVEPVWVFLVLILIVSAAQALIIADLYYAKRRLVCAEKNIMWMLERQTDMLLSLDPVTRERYDTARAARKIKVTGE